MEPRKQAIMAALDKFVAQRPGLEFGNYGDVKAYRAEMRGITRERHDYTTLARAVERSDSITADMLIKAAESAFSGRLRITEGIKSGNAKCPEAEQYVRIDYCAGQYFPTEYRKAACAVLASALWDSVRQNSMPEPRYVQYGSADDLPMRTEARYPLPGKRTGFGSTYDYLRAYFRREFGRSIANRWFS